MTIDGFYGLIVEVYGYRLCIPRMPVSRVNYPVLRLSGPGTAGLSAGYHIGCLVIDAFVLSDYRFLLLCGESPQVLDQVPMPVDQNSGE